LHCTRSLPVRRRVFRGRLAPPVGLVAHPSSRAGVYVRHCFTPCSPPSVLTTNPLKRGPARTSGGSFTQSFLSVGSMLCGGHFHRSIAELIMSILTGFVRETTRLNSSHVKISYAVFCLKKQKI